MKKVLLLSSVVLSLSASAQNFTATWEKPAAPEFSNFEPETKYYMWNVGARGFYINHQNGTGSPYWGTAASVNDSIGALVHFTKTNPSAEGQGKESWEYSKENTYLLVSYVSKFKEERCTFADNTKKVWTDNNTNEYRFFNVDVTGQTFTITPCVEMIQATFVNTGNNIENFPSDYVANPIGVVFNDVNFIVNISNTDTEWYTEWALVSEENYQKYIENLPAIKETNKLWVASEALRKTIEKAVAEYPDINLDAQVEVYNNTNSTVQELNDAMSSVADAIVAYTASKASINNPINYTSLIQNPSFDVQEDFTGWTPRINEGFKAGGEKFTSAECYGRAYDVYQTIKGLPTGAYIVKVNAYFRKEDSQKDYDAYLAGIPTDCEFYAQSGDFKSSVRIKHVCEGAVIDGFGAKDEKTFIDENGVTMTVPNTMLAADKYFHNEDGTINPRYENVVYTYVNNGELTIGVANSVGGGSDWSIFDDFQLYYIGDDEENYAILKTNIEKSLEYTLPENVVYSTQDLKEYNNAKEAFKATNGKAILTEYTNARNALNNLTESVDNYALYKLAINDAKDWYIDAQNNGVNEEIPAVEAIRSYLYDDENDNINFPNGTFAQIIVNDVEGTLTNKQIVEETAYVNELVAQAVSDGIFEGADLTSKITNPGFEIAGGKGWSTGSLGTPNNWYGGSDNNHNAEAFERNFDVYQDVEGLPNGLYEVSVQAFYRTAANSDAYTAYENDPEMTGDAKVLSYVYLNEFATPIRNVMEIQFDENLANNCFTTPAGTYTLDGMASASAAFSLDDEEKNFTMKVYGIITDGKMRLGIRGEGTNGSRWTLWDNFKLRYMGKNKVAVATVLKQKAETLYALRDQQEGEEDNKRYIANEYTRTFIDNQCAEAFRLVGSLTEINEKAVTFLDADELWNTLTNIGKAQAEVDEDIKAYKEFLTAKENLEYNQGDIVGDIQEEYYGIIEADAWENYKNKPRQELQALTARINKLLVWLNATSIEAFPEVKDDETLDLTEWIVNPGFEEDFTGWTQTNMQTQGNSEFAKTESKYCERWHQDMNLNVYQRFRNLPAGYYTLTVDAYNSTADGSIYLSIVDRDDNLISEAKTFVEDSGNAKQQAEYTVAIKYDGNGILNIGAKATLTNSTWFCVDNFRLSYSKVAPVAIENVETAKTSAPAGIYTISGTRIDKLAKGINIVKMANGTVKKVFVK